MPEESPFSFKPWPVIWGFVLLATIAIGANYTYSIALAEKIESRVCNEDYQREKQELKTSIQKLQDGQHTIQQEQVLIKYKLDELLNWMKRRAQDGK